MAHTKAPRHKRDLYFFILALAVVALDQGSKALVRAYLGLGQSFPYEAPLRLTHVANTGAAFGFFADQAFPLLVTAAIGVAAILFYYLYPPFQSPLLTISLGLQLGGATGNLVDRFRYGYVTDFIDLRVWPVFNLADSAITVGVAILVGYLLLARPAPR